MGDDVSSGGDIVSVVHDGFNVSSNNESADEIKTNFEAEPKPVDGEPADPEKDAKERVSRAASELGKKGGEAAAKAKEKAAKEAVAAPEDEDGGKDDAKPEKPLGKPRDDPRARVAQATQQLAEERRQRHALEQRLAQLETQVRRPAGDQRPEEQAAPQADDNAEPQEADFDDYAKYVKAQARWEVRQELKAHQQQQEIRQQAKAHADKVVGTVDTFHKRMADVTTKDPEFLERVEPRLLELQPSFMLPPDQRPGPHNVLADAFVASEQAAELMLYLTEHPDVRQRILGMGSRREMEIAIAKIEAKLEGGSVAAAPPPKPGVSRAKPPVKPVASTHTESGDITDEMSVEEHFTRMNSRDQAARRGR